MNKDTELQKLVKDTWEEMNRIFVPKNQYNEKELQSFLFDKFVQKRGSSKGIVRELTYNRNRIDIAIDNKVFMELEVHLKSGIRKAGRWRMRIERHAKPSLKKLAKIKKERPDALCYYAVYADSHKDEDDCWWQKIKEMCDGEKIEFLLCVRKK